jgi:hypothetical protein
MFDVKFVYKLIHPLINLAQALDKPYNRINGTPVKSPKEKDHYWLADPVARRGHNLVDLNPVGDKRKALRGWLCSLPSNRKPFVSIWRQSPAVMRPVYRYVFRRAGGVDDPVSKGSAVKCSFPGKIRGAGNIPAGIYSGWSQFVINFDPGSDPALSPFEFTPVDHRSVDGNRSFQLNPPIMESNLVGRTEQTARTAHMEAARFCTHSRNSYGNCSTAGSKLHVLSHCHPVDWNHLPDDRNDLYPSMDDPVKKGEYAHPFKRWDTLFYCRVDHRIRTNWFDGSRAVLNYRNLARAPILK